MTKNIVNEDFILGRSVKVFTEKQLGDLEIPDNYPHYKEFDSKLFGITGYINRDWDNYVNIVTGKDNKGWNIEVAVAKCFLTFNDNLVFPESVVETINKIKKKYILFFDEQTGPGGGTGRQYKTEEFQFEKAYDKDTQKYGIYHKSFAIPGTFLSLSDLKKLLAHGEYTDVFDATKNSRITNKIRLFNDNCPKNYEW